MFAASHMEVFVAICGYIILLNVRSWKEQSLFEHPRNEAPLEPSLPILGTSTRMMQSRVLSIHDSSLSDNRTVSMRDAAVS